MAYNPYTYPYTPAMPGYSQYNPVPPVLPQNGVQAAQPLNNSPDPVKPQIQNDGLVSVRSMQEAESYPVAPGKSITFKDETAPYVYTKTMGFSQLDRPVFEIFRLVKEEAAPKAEENALLKENKPDYALKSELEKLTDRVNEIEKALKEIEEDAV